MKVCLMVGVSWAVLQCANKQFKQIRNAWHFWFESILVFTAQWFRGGGSAAHYLIGRYELKKYPVVLL